MQQMYKTLAHPYTRVKQRFYAKKKKKKSFCGSFLTKELALKKMCGFAFDMASSTRSHVEQLGN